MNFKLKFFMTIFILLSLFQVTNVPLTNNTTSMTNSQDSVTGVIKVGVLVPLTGSLSTYSLGFLDGIKSAALAINKSSNYGFSIELVIADTGTNPTTTLSAYNTLKTDGVQLIIGPASSTDSLAIVQSASVDHIPIISYSSTSPMLSNKSYDYFYRTISSDILQMDALASVLNHFNQKKVVIAYQNDSYGASLENETRTSFVNLGISVAGELNYSLGTTDFSDMVTSISSISNVDGVVFIGFATEGGYFITQLRQSGNNLPVYSSSGGIPQTNINSNNIIGVDIVGGHVGQAMYDQFVSDLKTCNLDGVCSGGNTPRVFSDFSYDAMMVGALAVNMSATYDGATIKSNLPLAGTNYIGATGNKSFSALGDQIYGSTEIWQIQNQQVVNIGSYDNQTGLILKNLFHWQYKPHAQITISSNSDFTPNDFTGSGTQLKPYLLQGYSFTASINELISIQGTTAYFEISNCLFNGLNGT